MACIDRVGVQERLRGALETTLQSGPMVYLNTNKHQGVPSIGLAMLKGVMSGVNGGPYSAYFPGESLTHSSSKLAPS